MANENNGPQNPIPDRATLQSDGGVNLTENTDPFLQAPESPFPSSQQQTSATEQTPAPETDQGSSSDQLPDEYKPYSDIPWQNIPEEARPDVLQGVKKMHGGMTQQQQEVADLRKRSQILDDLVNQPWVQKAWQEQQQGGSQNNNVNNDQTSQLDSLDPDMKNAVDQLVNQRVQQIISPFQNQVQSLQQQQLNAQVQSDLKDLRSLAKEKNWPSPDSKLQQMYTLLNEGKVKDLKTAYRESVFDELPDLVSKQVRSQSQANAQQKVATSIPPGANSPSRAPAQGEFTGPNAVAEALNQSIRELQGA